MNPARVTPMAGNVRRRSSPAVTPRAKANAAYPPGTKPCTAKLPAPNRSCFRSSSGLSHHVAMRLSNPARRKLATPTRRA